MKKYHQVISVLVKVLEVLHWVGTASMLGLLLCTIAAKDWLCSISNVASDLSTYGFELSIVNGDGSLNLAAVRIFAVGAFLTIGLMAMVFRNLFLIFKSLKGKNPSPFQKDVIRMVREIGIFFISIPVIGLLTTILAQCIVGVDYIEVHTNLTGIVTGVIVLCLTQVFAYGAKLEKETEGLI